MQNDSLTGLSEDLLSIPPLIFRMVRRKLTETVAEDQELNVTPLRLEIMKLLEKEGSLHVSEIGEKLHIAKAQMTKLIDKLAAVNFVNRGVDTLDRRTINITLTDKAKTKLKETDNKVIGAVQQIISSLDREELTTLAAALRNVKNILLKAQQPPAKAK